jgi:predicted GIY-YIG superfamily endonuclease
MTHYVYRYYNADDDLLYVGCSKNPWQRYKTHRADSRLWIREVTRGRISVFPDKPTALAAERAAVETEHPRYNRKLRGDRSAWTPEQYQNYAYGYLAASHYPESDWSSAHMVGVREEYACKFGAILPTPLNVRRSA